MLLSQSLARPAHPLQQDLSLVCVYVSRGRPQRVDDYQLKAMVYDLLVQPGLPSFIRGGKASLNLHGHRNVCLWRSPLELRSAGVGNLTLPEQGWDLCFSDVGQSLHNKEQIILFLKV